VGRLRLQGGRPNARTSSRPRTLNHETTENGVTADDDRKSRASGLANHRVVNEARSAQRDRMKIDAPYLEKSTVTLQLRPRSGVENEAEKRCLDRPIGEQPFFQVMPLSGPDNMHLGASLGGRVGGRGVKLRRTSRKSDILYLLVGTPKFKFTASSEPQKTRVPLLQTAK
jgi:hypothetical protein